MECERDRIRHVGHGGVDGLGGCGVACFAAARGRFRMQFFRYGWAYGDGHSEQLLGKILRVNPGKRLYAATKVPPKNRQWPARREYSLDDCYPPEYIEEYVAKSLANLGLKTLDLIQLHTWEDKR